MMKALGLDKKARLNGGRLDLVFLNTLKQKVTLIVFKSKIHVSLQ
jgi:hypothetical protein